MFKKGKNKTYFVGGINGVGKSAILDKLLEIDNRFTVLSGSKYFMQWLGLKEGDYKTLQLLPHNFKNKELNKMMQYLIHNPLAKNKSLLISAHYLRIIEGEISDAIDDWISLFDGLFLIIAEPKMILKRLENDFLVNGRNRNIFPQNISNENKLHLLNKYQAITLKKIKELSKKFNIPFFVIQNNLLEKALSKFINCLNNLETKSK